MVTVVGIGALRDAAPARPPKDRARDTADVVEQTSDGVSISQEAQQASEAARIQQMSEQQSEIRQERVDAAKESIRNGSYKVQEAVLGVAVKVMPYLA